MQKNTQCKENWEVMPYSSEHVFSGNGMLTAGTCNKCGLEGSLWRRHLDLKVEEVMKKLEWLQAYEKTEKKS